MADSPSEMGVTSTALATGEKTYNGAISVTLDFSRPGKLTDNAYIESFNGSFRDECLDAHWFLPAEHARAKIES